jgi:putative addiction module component (TIGR02574 family)
MEMTAAAQKQIFKQVLAMPRKARVSLRRQLDKSLSEDGEEKISKKEWNRAWKAELDKRMAEIDSGRVKCVPYSEVRKKLDRILGKS